MAVIALLAAVVLAAADQLIKVLVLGHLKPVGSISIIDNFFSLTYVENYGAAFGILQNQKWLFIVLTAIISCIIIYALFAYKSHTFLSYSAAILILAGGIGNIIDRIRLGFVVDYLSFSFFSPVFNFADCCVTVGTVLLIIHVLFFSEKGHAPKHFKP